MINATQVREGMIIKLHDELYKVTWTMHRTPGKGDACIQTRLKNVINNKNLEHRFRSSDKVDRVDIRSRKMQFLYKQDEYFTFMDEEDFEQYNLTADLIGDAAQYLLDANSYQVQLYDEMPVGIELPKSIELEVTMAPPEIKKATASSSLRPVTVKNDITVNVPAFIKTGDIIRINTDDGSYIERVT